MVWLGFSYLLQQQPTDAVRRQGKGFAAVVVGTGGVAAPPSSSLPLAPQTPLSNTGSNSHERVTVVPPKPAATSYEPYYQPDFEPYVDYLQGTGYCSYSDLQALIKFYTDNAIDEVFSKNYTYKYIGDTRYLHTYHSLLSMQVQFAPLGIDVNADMNAGMASSNADIQLEPFTPVKFHLTLSGKPLAALGYETVLFLMRMLRQSYNFRCSRTDPKVRCHKRIIDFKSLEQIVENKDFTPLMKPYFYQSPEFRGTSEGRTVTLGKPSSDKRISFYDALPVHGVDALDIEVRFRNARAHSAFEQILGTDEENLNFGQSAEVIHKLVSGSVDFIQKEDGVKNYERCLRYEFWGLFIDVAGGAIRVRKPQLQFSGIRQMQWIETKCYRAIAMAKELLGPARFSRWITDMCDKGKSSFTSEHDAYLRLYKQSRFFQNIFVKDECYG
jgi:hypothetical protein